MTRPYRLPARRSRVSALAWPSPLSPDFEATVPWPTAPVPPVAEVTSSPGVDVRARRTGVRLRVVFAGVRALLTGLLVVLRLAFALLAVAFAFGFVRLAATVLAFFLLVLPFTARFAAASAPVPRAAAFAAFL